MNIEIVDQIPAALHGAPPKLVGLREDGAFGLVKVEASAVKLEGRTLSVPKAMLLSDIIQRAREIVSGDSRALTTPGVTTDLAVSVLAIAAQLGRVAMLLEATQQDLAAADGELSRLEAEREDAMREALDAEAAK